MTRAQRIIWTRAALITGSIGVIELLCRAGVIKPLTMIAPSQMVLELARMTASGELAAPAAYTFAEVGGGFAVSVLGGAALGGAGPCATASASSDRSAVGELVRGAILCFLSIVGGFVRFERPAVDRHWRDFRSARDDAEYARRSRPGADGDAKGGARAQAVAYSGSAADYFAKRRAAFVHGAEAGLRLFVHRHYRRRVYSFQRRFGYGIAYAYESFENRTMYALMLFVLLVAVGVNGVLQVWDGRLARRWGRQ